MTRSAAARACYRRRAWKDAYEMLRVEREGLGAEDLERLAVSAYLVGEGADCDDAWTRAHRRHLDVGDLPGAVRCAFWQGFRLLNAHELPTANAWIARIERLVPADPVPSQADGRRDYLTGLRAAFEGDLDGAAADLARAAAVATHRRDDELAALARLSLGRVRIFLGDFTTGIRLLDDAMLVVGSEPISPIAVGDSYCTAIDACHDVVDVRRGRAWTAELTRWCAAQPDLVPFVGVCQVHRAEFLALQGDWTEAMAQADLAQARLAEPVHQPAYGAACYQRGEMHRLLGEFDRAEVCYRDASAAGRDPQPGLALLRLRQGRSGEAAQAIDRAVAEARDAFGRSALLAACVEIMLAADRVGDAAAAAADLGVVAAELGSPMLDAVARRAAGRLRLAEQDPRAALADLRRASDGFRALGAPYEVACTAVLIGTARAAVGDAEGAALEFHAARTVFEGLGARPDLIRTPGYVAAGLTAREIQVLRLVAEGATNRSIGTALGLSERTVDRHVSNIFAKLGVSSRAAAAAQASRTGLI